LVGFLAVIGFALFIYARFKKSEPQVPQSPTNYTAPKTVDKHREGTASGESPITERGTRKVTVTVRDTVGKQDSIGTIHTHSVEVVVSPEAALVSVDARPPAQSDVSIDVWTAPWFEIHPAIVLGASVNQYAEPSVAAGVSFVNAWEKWHAGGVIDRFGAQVFVGYEIKANILLYIAKPIVEYHNRPVSATLGIGLYL
jgi:hypothetical protein